MRTRLLLPILLAAAGAACRGPAGRAGKPGDPGDPGSGGSAPRIQSLTPPVGSVRNLVTILGTNFDPALTGDDVRFGGDAGQVTFASATELQVVPPFNLAPGVEPVTVSVGAQVSNAAGFTLVESGTGVDFAAAAIAARPGDPALLADGTVIVPDGAGGILSLSTSGVLTVVATGQGLASPSRVIPRQDGSLLVADPSAGGLLQVDPVSGVVTVVHWGSGYAGASEDAAGNLYLIPASGDRVDRLAADGTYTTGWGTLVAGAGAVDLQVVGGEVFVALDGAAKAIVKYAIPAGGSPSAVPVTTTIGAIHCLSASGGALLAGGTFSATGNSEGVAKITTDGLTVTAMTATGEYGRVDGVLERQAGDLLMIDGLAGAIEHGGPHPFVLAGTAAHAVSSVRSGGVTYVSVHNGATIPGWIEALADDGSSRLVATGSFSELQVLDAQTLISLSPDTPAAERVTIATGVVDVPFLLPSTLAGATGVALDSAGNWFFADPVTNHLAKLDSAGNVVALDFAPVTGAASLRVEGGYLYVAEPSQGRVDRVALADGTVIAWIAAAAGLTAPAASLHDIDPSVTHLYVPDAGTGALYLVDSAGFVEPYGPPVADAASVTQQEDGMIVVGGSDGLHRITP